MASGRELLGWLAFLTGLVLVSTGYRAYQQLSLTRVSDLAPYVKPTELETVCGTGKCIRTTLYTSTFGAETPYSTFAFERLSIFIKGTTDYGRGSRKVIPDHWDEIQHQPDELTLFCKPGMCPIKLSVTEFDTQSIPATYESPGPHSKRLDIPRSWLPFVQVETCRLRLQTLPCSKKVQVIGTIWRTKSGLRLIGFNYTLNPFGGRQHQKVIMSVEAD